MMRFSMRAYSLSIVDFRSCDFRTKLPRTTTCSPALSPSSTGVLPSAVSPMRTGRTVKRSGDGPHEDHVLPVDLLHGIGRHQQAPACASADGNLRGGQHLRPQAIAGVVEHDPHLHRRESPRSSSCPRLVILPGKRCAGHARQRDGRGLADAQLAEILLTNGSEHPDL